MDTKNPDQCGDEADLAQRLLFSTLAPRVYEPSAATKLMYFAAVFVDDSPVILCGPSDDPQSVYLADALATSDKVTHLLSLAGLPGHVHTRSVSGRHIEWYGGENAVVSKRSGQRLADGGDTGPLLAIVLADPVMTLTNRLCADAGIARLFDREWYASRLAPDAAADDAGSAEVGASNGPVEDLRMRRNGVVKKSRMR